MVRKLAALFALVLTLGMVVPAAAQDVNMDDAKDLGLESGYLRMYMADPSAATANTDQLGVMVAGFQFKDADTAADSFEDFSCGFAGGFLGVAEATDCDSLASNGFEVADVDGMGDQAIEVLGASDELGPITMLSIQDGEYLYLVINLGVSEAGSTDALGKFLVDAKPVDTEVMFAEDGTSTGGFFDMLPQEGDAEIEGLLPMMDMDFFGTGASTPAV